MLVCLFCLTLKVVPVQRSIFSQRLWVFALEDGVLGVCFTRFCSIQFGTIPEIELAVQDCMLMTRKANARWEPQVEGVMRTAASFP
jgi:hypothetical protein